MPASASPEASLALRLVATAERRSAYEGEIRALADRVDPARLIRFLRAQTLLPLAGSRLACARRARLAGARRCRGRRSGGLPPPRLCSVDARAALGHEAGGCRDPVPAAEGRPAGAAHPRRPRAPGSRRRGPPRSGRTAWGCRGDPARRRLWATRRPNVGERASGDPLPARRPQGRTSAASSFTGVSTGTRRASRASCCSAARSGKPDTAWRAPRTSWPRSSCSTPVTASWASASRATSRPGGTASGGELSAGGLQPIADQHPEIGFALATAARVADRLVGLPSADLLDERPALSAPKQDRRATRKLEPRR